MILLIRTIGFISSGYWLGYAASALTDNFVPLKTTVAFLALTVGLVNFVFALNLGGAKRGRSKPPKAEKS